MATEQGLTATDNDAAAQPRPRVLFVEQFYFPDGWGGAELPLDITVHLARSGFEVEVICGSDQYAPLEGEPPPDPRLQGVRLRRIPALLGGSIHRAKLLRQLWFYVALAPLLLLRRPPHAFVTQTNPPLAVIMVVAVARLWRRPAIVIAMDVYPEVLIAHGSVRAAGLAGRLLRRAFGWAYRHAERVVALGPVMRERLQAKGVDAERIVEIPNWSTGAPGLLRGADNRLRAEWDLQGRFVVVYSGNLGFAHEFETFLQAVQVARRTLPALRVVFIGHGSRLNEVRRRVEELQIADSIRFSDLLPAQRLPESLGIADLALVTLQPAFAGLVVPSKLQGYMARGVAVLYVGPDSDIERFIMRAGCGACLRPGDVQGVAQTLLRLAAGPEQLARLAERGRQFYAEQFASAHGLDRYVAVIAAAVGTRTP